MVGAFFQNSGGMPIGAAQFCLTLTLVCATIQFDPKAPDNTPVKQKSPSAPPPPPRDLLEREGGCGSNSPAATERLQGTAKAVGGRLLAVGDAVGAGVGVWECLWGRVRARALVGRGYPPPFKRFPAPPPLFVIAEHLI